MPRTLLSLPHELTVHMLMILPLSMASCAVPSLVLSYSSAPSPLVPLPVCFVLLCLVLLVPGWSSVFSTLDVPMSLVPALDPLWIIYFALLLVLSILCLRGSHCPVLSLPIPQSALCLCCAPGLVQCYFICRPASSGSVFFPPGLSIHLVWCAALLF